MNCGICSACDVGKKCCKRMLLGSAAFNEPVCIPRSRNTSALLGSGRVPLLGCQFMTSPGQDRSKLANVCCQLRVADPSVVPSGQM